MYLLLFSVLLLAATLLFVNRALSKIRTVPTRTNYDYDAIIVGGSIAGPMAAKALAMQGRKVLLVERSLFTKPDRIVGELLQPGGINALKSVNMEHCALSIGMPCHGYLIVDQNQKNIDLPYSGSAKGVSFHFGEFVQNLRKDVFDNCSAQVTMLEGTVTNILTEGSSCFERAYGIEYTMAADYKAPESPFLTNPPKYTGTTVRKTATAPLVIMCDGGMSKWKGRYQHYTPARDYHSNFVAVIAKTARLPVEQRGTVFFGKTGPIISYRLDPDELRFLVDYNAPQLPSLQKQSEWLMKDVAPCLPENIRSEFCRVAADTANIRSMAVARYPPTFPCIKRYVGIGDHGNQRHPLTGGGMTCAFGDAIRLAENLKSIPSLRSDDATEMALIEDRIQDAIVRYSRHRFIHTCCINLLSWALYDVFSDVVLRTACFDYFVRGGECVSVPMDLLAGLNPSVVTLMFHYCKVMLNGILNIMMKSGEYSSKKADTQTNSEKLKNLLTFFMEPSRMYAAAYILVKSTMIALPLAVNEFCSVWRFLDPTSVVAIISKRIKAATYTHFRNGKQRKPVGL